MNKKLLILLIILVVSISFIFTVIRRFRRGFRYSQEVAPQVKVEKKKEVSPFHKKVSSSKIKPKSFEDVSLDELEKNKNLKPPSQEFDLYPSMDDLIRFKKEKIQAY